VGSVDKQLITYPDKFHEIFNDPGHETVFSDILEWLNPRLPASQVTAAGG
jgi:alpha-beta hydrolase superfamily lysophospholipase